MAVAGVPNTIKDTFRAKRFDENIVLEVLTLERTNVTSNAATGKLEKVESSAFQLSARTLKLRVKIAN